MKILRRGSGRKRSSLSTFCFYPRNNRGNRRLSRILKGRRRNRAEKIITFGIVYSLRGRPKGKKFNNEGISKEPRRGGTTPDYLGNERNKLQQLKNGAKPLWKKKRRGKKASSTQLFRNRKLPEKGDKRTA